jgi:hypothetical protein
MMGDAHMTIEARFSFLRLLPASEEEGVAYGPFIGAGKPSGTFPTSVTTRCREGMSGPYLTRQALRSRAGAFVPFQQTRVSSPGDTQLDLPDRGQLKRKQTGRKSDDSQKSQELPQAADTPLWPINDHA